MSGPLFPGGVGTICLCWKIVRPDGVTLGFTTHDRAIVRDGLTYEPNAGMTPSAIQTSASYDIDSMAIAGILDSARIGEADLRSGRWAGATLRVFAHDWQHPEQPDIFLTEGVIGDVRRMGLGGDGPFQMELLSPLAALSRRRVLTVSPSCRAQLGDQVCGVDMAGRTLDLEAVARGRRLLEAGAPVADGARFLLGRMRIIGGRHAGLGGTVAAIDGALVTVTTTAELEADERLRVRLWEGCDKTFATCCNRFRNGAAFDGEPHLPGNDALVRYGVG